MHLLAISPHLDDAVFSAGATLWERAQAGDRVTILTCFTGNVARPQGFALACQLDKGLPAEVDYMALRRAEDEAACAVLGAAAVHLPLLEAPHRGYVSAAALFGERLAEDRIAGPLREALAEQLDRLRPDRMLGPYGVGAHVDHLYVRDVLTELVEPARLAWWEDYPYAMREAEPPPEITRRAVSEVALAAKVEATLCYTTQLAFQFGGAEKARRAMAAWRHEGSARATV